MQRMLRYTPLAAAALFFSCAQENLVPNVTINNPIEMQVFQVGSSLPVTATSVDDRGMSQTKIEVIPRHTDTVPGLSTFVAFYDITVQNTPGTNATPGSTFTIPTDALPGPYMIKVSSLDNGGNEGVATVNIIIENALDTRNPTASFNLPLAASTHTGSLQVDALITDKMSDLITDGTIEYIRVKLVKVTDNSIVYELGTFTGLNNFAGTYNANSGVFQKTFALSGNIESGDYYVVLKTRDIYFNSTEIQVQINIQN